MDHERRKRLPVEYFMMMMENGGYSAECLRSFHGILIRLVNDFSLCVCDTCEASGWHVCEQINLTSVTNSSSIFRMES